MPKKPPSGFDGPTVKPLESLTPAEAMKGRWAIAFGGPDGTIAEAEGTQSGLTRGKGKTIHHTVNSTAGFVTVIMSEDAARDLAERLTLFIEGSA